MSSSLNRIRTGKIVGDGNDKSIVLGFKPRNVKLWNEDSLQSIEKSDSMADGQALRRVTAGTMSDADLLDLDSGGFTIKAAANIDTEVIHYVAYEGKNE